ncbi:NUDIX domain-containing protein [Aurantimonas sp. 22II-16-19i]|uniref:NUDIX domain-containing protein n=1 Tax=Aurantimonas sp. 22II-16-19i TaxID=1317114 RepID=UPI0009F7F0A0|nr:NUDIX domain-containing protein [Aurantimonas sp. 22II-16-19i]ORE94864.1 NUDIX family hydrolase [Aurantimonas sp. 22II-16-19i]
MDERKRPFLGVSICLSSEAGVLLARRGKAPYRGLWSLPGGGVEHGETLEAAARRELLEETGLVPDDLIFATLHEAIADGSHAVIAVYAGRLPADRAPIAGDDAEALETVGLAEIERREAAGETTAGLSRVVAGCLDRERRCLDREGG